MNLPFDGTAWATAAQGHWEGEPPQSVRGFAIDSRILERGEVFFALKTARRDGHDFVAAAAERGAAFAVVSRHLAEVALPQLVVPEVDAALQRLARWRRENFVGPVVGITGSFGKTSTKDLLQVILGKKRTWATPGNWNNRLGVALSLLYLDNERFDRAVLEAGISQKGEMAELAGMIRPTHTIVTTIGEAHLEGFGTLEAIAEEKSALPHAMNETGLFVTAVECRTFASLADVPGRTIWVAHESDRGHPAEGQYRVEDVVLGDCLTSRRLVVREGTREKSYRVPLVSEAMVGNAALAVTMARALGVPEADISRRLPKWRAGSLRGQLLATNQMLVFIDCYNASPTTMIESARTFQQLADPSLARFYVFGGMEELGPSAAARHYETGQRIVLRSEDSAAVLGEHAERFRDGLQEAAENHPRIQTNPPREAVARELQQFRGAVFLKGSRKHRLEELLPREAQEGQGHS